MLQLQFTWPTSLLPSLPPQPVGAPGESSTDSSDTCQSLCSQGPGRSDSKGSACSAGDLGSIPGSGRFPWRREWQPTAVFLPGEFHGQRSLMDHNPWGRKDQDKTRWLTQPQRRRRCPLPSPPQSHRRVSHGQSLNHTVNPSH